MLPFLEKVINLDNTPITMSNKLIAFFVFLLSTGTIISAQDRIDLRIPTLEEETAYVWRTIIDVKFFEEHNYQISLPQGELINTLKEKSKLNQLNDDDYEALKVYMENKVYKKADYESGYNKIAEHEALINKMVNQMSELKTNWPFKEYDKYEVKLTLYGPGGSYDPDRGSILIYTTTDGRFKQYNNPTNTIIHEIFHIGTEASLINKYQVPHTLKERIIDHLVLINFREYLPDYRLQGFGDPRIDEYLKTKKDIKKLDKIIAKFQKEHIK